jgi:hypothetical protein
MAQEQESEMITRDMVNAGVEALCQLDRDHDSSRRIVTDVYQAMAHAAKQPPMIAAASDHQSVEQSHWWLT